MIFVTDKGRMANNIFQYAQLYAWGREHGRSTMSMRFAYKYHGFKICNTRYHNILVYLAAKLAAKLHVIPTVNFDGTENHQIETLLACKHALVTGWSVRFYDLVDKYKNEIISLFDFSNNIKDVVHLKMNQDSPGTIRLGVHIRRGDYKTWLGGRFYFDDGQYISIIRQFVAQHPDNNISIYICSNDPKLQKKLYCNELAPATLHFPNGNAAEDLCLLSECDYLIGPLSSFTLVASMYHDTPLYWMMKGNHFSIDSFQPFSFQSRHFDSFFGT